MKEMTAWEEATCGHLLRLIKVYRETVRRAKARGLLPDAIKSGVSDEGWTMIVMHPAIEGSIFFPARMFDWRRDGYVGTGAQPPWVFKAALRQFMVKPEGDTLQ